MAIGARQTQEPVGRPESRGDRLTAARAGVSRTTLAGEATRAWRVSQLPVRLP
jgi:hypothetical protein